MPLHAIVGVSAGAVVAAYYAAVGLELEEMIQDAETFRGRHLLAHSLSVRCGSRLTAFLRSQCGVIPRSSSAARRGELRSAPPWRQPPGDRLPRSLDSTAAILRDGHRLDGHVERGGPRKCVNPTAVSRDFGLPRRRSALLD